MIYLTGDTHGDLSINKLSKRKTSKEIDNLIILGDFGLLWSDIETNNEKYWLDWLSEKPYDIIITLGNHENYNRIEKLPIIIRYNNPVYKVRENIFMLHTGYVYTIENKTFFNFNGATSIDKSRRVLNKSYWTQEIPSEKEFQRAIKTIETYKKVDYVLSHTIPTNIIQHLEDKEYIVSASMNDKVSNMLSIIDTQLEYKQWFAGHFHIDYTYKEKKVTILFDEIIPLDNSVTLIPKKINTNKYVWR